MRWAGGLVRDGMNGIIGLLNRGIGAINAVLGKLGIKARIPPIPTITGTLQISNSGGRRGGSNTFAEGGPVRGPGGTTTDRIPAMLSNKEYVINAKSVRGVGESTLNFINKYGRVPFAAGGPVYQQMMGWAKSHLPGVRFSSTLRRGDPGYHGRGQAVDMTFSDGSERRGGGLAQRAFWAIRNSFMPRIAELIWDFAGRNAVWNGKPHFFTGGGAGPGTHNDHIHWALASGGGGLGGLLS
jgi:hypothetical protein